MTGQLVYDRNVKLGLPSSLSRFLNEVPLPIVFTIGSAVFTNAGPFYEHSAACAGELGRRAVFVVDSGHLSQLRSLTSDGITVEYAPFGELFLRAAVVVHYGEVGTTALALRSGRPMLIVPFAWDQPGIARIIPKHRCTKRAATATLRELLDDPLHLERAAKVAEQANHEQGIGTACDALESLL